MIDLRYGLSVYRDLRCPIPRLGLHAATRPLSFVCAYLAALDGPDAEVPDWVERALVEAHVIPDAEARERLLS